jgi:hypothetical protein
MRSVSSCALFQAADALRAAWIFTANEANCLRACDAGLPPAGAGRCEEGRDGDMTGSWKKDGFS